MDTNYTYALHNIICCKATCYTWILVFFIALYPLRNILGLFKRQSKCGGLMRVEVFFGLVRLWKLVYNLCKQKFPIQQICQDGLNAYEYLPPCDDSYKNLETYASLAQRIAPCGNRADASAGDRNSTAQYHMFRKRLVFSIRPVR